MTPSIEEAGEAGGGPFWRRPWSPLLGVVLVALAVRALYLPELLHAFPYFAAPDPGNDAYDYQKWAEAIAAGDWLSRFLGPFYLAPLYPYLLGLLLAVTGAPPVLAGLTLNALAGACNAALAARIARRCFGVSAAWIAGLLAGLNGSQIAAEGMLLNDPLLAPLLLAGVWRVLALGDRLARGESVSWRSALGLGMLLALPTLGRASNLLPAVGLGLWFAAVSWRRWEKRGLPLILAAALGGALILSLPVARNGALYGAWVLTTNGPLAFYVGNEPAAFGINKPHHDFAQLQARVTQRAQWWDELAAAHQRHPGRWGDVLWRKTQLFFNAWDIPDNYDYHFLRRHLTALRWLTVDPWILLCLGFTGAALTWRRWRALLPLHLFAGLFALSIIAVTVSGRYRLPFHDWLAILAGGGATTLWRLSPPNRWRGFAGAAVLAVGLALLFTPRYPQLCLENRCTQELAGFPLRSMEYQIHGVALMNRGRFAEAEGLFREAVGLFPGDAQVHERLAHLLLQQGRHAEAEAAAAAGLRGAGPSVHLWELRLRALIPLGRFEEIDPVLNQLLHHDPDHPFGRQLRDLLRQEPARGDPAGRL
ncbi:MAG: tetratricopeptide repeat protein [Magnetococcales bacterium]|nr:tetratricopeptide repeat protein [Magnetococcales bacterium]